MAVFFTSPGCRDVVVGNKPNGTKVKRRGATVAAKFAGLDAHAPTAATEETLATAVATAFSEQTSAERARDAIGFMEVVSEMDNLDEFARRAEAARDHDQAARWRAGAKQNRQALEASWAPEGALRLRAKTQGVPFETEGERRTIEDAAEREFAARMVVGYVVDHFPLTSAGVPKSLIEKWKVRNPADHEEKLYDALRVLGATKNQGHNWVRPGNEIDPLDDLLPFLRECCVSFHHIAAVRALRDKLRRKPTLRELRAALRATASTAANFGFEISTPTKAEAENAMSAFIDGVPSNELRDAYVKWCAATGSTPIGGDIFAKAIARIPGLTPRPFGRAHLKGWRGIGLRKG